MLCITKLQKQNYSYIADLRSLSEITAYIEAKAIQREGKILN